MTGQPDVALDHLELARRHLVLARHALLGAVPIPVLTVTTGLPYDAGKHGTYTAPSAAAVAAGVEPEPSLIGARVADRVGPGNGIIVGLADGEHVYVKWDGGYDPMREPLCALRLIHPQPAPTGHLPEHTHGEGPCTHKGCRDAGHDLPAPTAEADAGRLAAHAPRGAL